MLTHVPVEDAVRIYIPLMGNSTIIKCYKAEMLSLVVLIVLLEVAFYFKAQSF